MKDGQFRLDSREKAEKFDALLGRYLKKKTGAYSGHISLVRVWDQLELHPNKGRIFAALFDILVSFSHLEHDLYSMCNTWNSRFSKGKLQGGSIFDSEKKFFGKLDLHRFETAFVFRYRALWDKLMGVIVLVEKPNKYVKL